MMIDIDDIDGDDDDDDDDDFYVIELHFKIRG
jgi:hypothetical protein